jgi:hypothetical protein
VRELNKPGQAWGRLLLDQDFGTANAMIVRRRRLDAFEATAIASVRDRSGPPYPNGSCDQVQQTTVLPNAVRHSEKDFSILVTAGVDEPQFSGYTPGMKTAISLPDEVFEDAEKLASRLKVSRSELYARALQDYVRQHAPDAVTEAYNRVCSEVESQPDEFIRRAARATLKRAEW